MKWVSAAWQRHHARHIFSLLFLFLLHSTAAAPTPNSFPPPPNPYAYGWTPRFNSPPPPDRYAYIWKPRFKSPPPPNPYPYGWKPQFNSPPPPNLWFKSSPKAKFNAGVIVVIIVFTSFPISIVFCIIYIGNLRARHENQSLPTVGDARAHGSGAAGGLDPAVVESFPKFVYSEVKQHKIGKGALECAVCLSEFEGGDNLRLLPKCDHVFHPDCIDSWFASHTTCPVCRTNFSAETGAAAALAMVITVNDGGERPAEERSEEEQLLPPLLPRWQQRRIPRSHSTGQLVQLANDRERYTLRLPEVIRRDVVAGKFKRSASCYAAGEGNARKGRIGEDMIGGGRSSFKTRTWDRFVSFKRSLSAKMGRGKDAGTSGGAAAEAGRSLSQTKYVLNAEDVSVNVPTGADL